MSDDLKSDKESLSGMNTVLKRMLNTPPKPHKDSLTKGLVKKKGDAELVTQRRPGSRKKKGASPSS